MTFQSDFTWHTNALAGNRGPINANEPMHGWYRHRTTSGQYESVAYWLDSETGELRCHVNGKTPRDPLRAIEIWPFASRNVISADDYWHRMDTGQWRDNDAAAIEVAKGPDIDPQADPVGSIRAEIAKAKAGAASYVTIDSDEQAARAQTLRSAATALAGKADKAREAEKAPHWQKCKEVDATWQPVVQEAKTVANDIRKALEAWETIKLENQRRADGETRRRQEQAAREAEKPGSAPIDPPKVDPVKPNTPPPALQIKGASGRAASVGSRKVVKSIDLDHAFAQFGALPEVYDFFMQLAQKAVDAGRDVPGAVIEEKATVK